MQPAPSIEIDTDFCAWCLEQAAALRQRRYFALDWENLAEELEAMARKDRSRLRSYLKNLLQHLLKWQFSRTERHLYERSWRLTINEAGRQIGDILEDSPSLGNRDTLGQEIIVAYSRAREDAAVEMGLDPDAIPFPTICPWSFDVFMNRDFLPTPIQHQPE